MHPWISTLAGQRHRPPAGRWTRLPVVALAAWLGALLCAVLPPVARAGEPVIIAVGKAPYSLGFYVAGAKNYFAAEGVNVKLVDCFPGRKCLADMLAGKAHMATASDTPIVIASFTRTDLSVLGAVATASNAVQVLARKSSGIATPAQLIGRRIGVVKGTGSDYFLNTLLLYHGIDPAKVTEVSLEASDIVAALGRREIDAASVFQPGLAQARILLGSDVVQMPAPNIYTTFYNLVAARSFTGPGAADITRVLRALERARRDIEADPAGARKIMQDKLQLDPASVAAIFPTLDFRFSLDQSLVKTLESEARWYARQPGAIGRKPANYLDFIDPAPLSRLQAATATAAR